jgi:4-alpha-glucanotransferase
VNGVQLHPTSLPGGRLGAEAYAFVDWLAAAGQSWWQTLPLGPTGEGGSPYKSRSAFAGAAELLAEPDAPVSAAEIAGLREREAYWLADWEAFAGAGAVEDQVRFDREWTALREYAAARGVGIIGDLPIYVAADGADHRAHPELFQTGAQAGAPPDKFTDRGQLWGNPLYDWPALRRRRYRWWVERLRRTSRLVDLSRIDHFRGFVAYWSVPAGDTDASGGHWARGPGRALFEAIRRELGDLPLVAENLGEITPAVERLRHDLNLPGMAVMQFAFDPDEPNSP